MTLESIGSFVREATLLVGSNARGRDGVTENIRVGGTDLRLRQRQNEVVFPKLFEQSRNGEDVSGGIRIEHDNIIEVSGHVGKAFHDFLDHHDEPSRRLAAPLWDDQPPEEARGHAQCPERGRVLVNRYLVERRD